MTEDKSKRKSTRSFNLDKHVKRTFNLEKETEPAASPTPKSTASSTPKSTSNPSPVTSDSTTTDNGTASTGNGKRTLGIIVGVIVVAGLIAFGAIRGCGGSSVTAPTADSTVSDTTYEPTDTTHCADSTQQTNSMPDASSQEDTPSTNAPSAPQQSAQSSAENATSESTQPTTAAANPTDNVDLEVQKVLKGVYGNGQERKDKLGASYAKIQRKVNELYRKGLVR
jgi:putative N-acetylmuramoyl-L-alanine amidase